MATIRRLSDRERERLRRSAIGPDQGPSSRDQTGDFGRPSNFTSPSSRALKDPTHLSFPFLRRLRKDPMIAFGLHFIITPLLKANWYMDCRDARVAAFADNLIRHFYGRLLLQITRHLWAGYSPMVKRYELVKPDWTYLDTTQGGLVERKVWDSSVDALVYRSTVELEPEICAPRWNDKKEFDGIKYDRVYGKRGFFVIDGQEKTEIDVMHALWATHDREGEDGSIYGYPRIGYAAQIYWSFWYLWELWLRAFENNADPGPVVRYPQGDPPLATEPGEEPESNVDRALRIGKARRSGSTAALPSEGHESFDGQRTTTVRKWDIEYPKHDTNFEAMANAINTMNAMKLQALWLPEQGLIEGSGGTSSRNVAHEFGDMRNESQTVLMQAIDELIINYMISPLVSINFPEFEGTIAKKTIGFGQSDEDVVRQLIQLIGQEDFKKLGIDIRRLMAMRGIPMLSPAEYERQQEEVAAKTPGPPPVEGVAGRRAAVTQTGFNEMTYVQVGDRIELAEDSEFLEKLPKTKHFSDRVIRSMTRQLRRASRDFFSAVYEQAAQVVSQEKFDLSQFDPTEDLEDREDLLVGPRDAAHRVVAKFLDRWSPDAETLASYEGRIKTLYGKLIRRAARVELSLAKRKAKITDEDVASWVDDHGAELVTTVIETVREELKRFLASQIREGNTNPKQLAASLREHFADFPGWKADRLARTELTRSYNFATLLAAKSAGVKKVQALDASAGTDLETDEPCRKRNGRIFSVEDALKQDVNHPNCTLGWRLMPRDSLSVEYVTNGELPEGMLARFDEASGIIYLSADLDETSQERYLVTLGEALTR